jgi:hypothetical protein
MEASWSMFIQRGLRGRLRREDEETDTSRATGLRHSELLDTAVRKETGERGRGRQRFRIRPMSSKAA